MRLLLALLLVVAFTLLSGCGKVWVVRVDQDAAGTEEKTQGVRFYRPAPYVWIAPITPPNTSVPAYTAQIVFLPDPEAEYVIHWKNGWFGSVHPKFAIENGWNLTSFEADVNTGLSAAIALQGTLSKEIKVAGDIPGLYKLKYDDRKEAWTIGEKVP